MKKVISMILALTMIFTLAACGGSKAKEAPDLQAYYDGFMTGLGADNTPATMNANEDPSIIDGFFPGLNDIELKQSVIQMAMMMQVAFEMALVECANAEDVETVKEIFQARIDAQVNGGAWYPAIEEAWSKAALIVKDNVVALIVAGEAQDKAVADFEALFN